ncbi:MAG: MerR family transcriptional regulator [Bacteroidota bacterium]
MDFYQINDLERLSGVKAHTIRIWEKRYGLITPHRTETNIRYYDDSQLKKILNVATLSTVGFKISKIAAMSEQELKIQIKESQQHELSDSRFDFYVNDFIGAMLDFNEQYFNELFAEVVEKFGVQSAMVNILYPFLYKTGVLWRVDEAIPVQEHFASMLIRRNLFLLIGNLPAPKDKSKKFLLFLPSNEWHEIGLLFAEYIIRHHGLETINLGQHVPYVDLEHVIIKAKPDFLLTFLISDTHEEYISHLQNLLSSKYKKTLCLISGNPAKLDIYSESKNLKILRFPKDILKVL